MNKRAIYTRLPPCASSRSSHHYTSLLQSDSEPGNLPGIHAQVITSGLELDRFVATGLVSRYAALGLAGVAAARQVFDRAPHRDGFLWNAMIRGHATAGPPREAVELFARMRRAAAANGGCAHANRYTYTFVVKACAAVVDARVGRAVHALAVSAGTEPCVFVGNALVALYARRGDVAAARKVFDGVAEKDAVSWNSMIAGYAQNGRPKDAVALLRPMLRGGAARRRCRPDDATLVAALSACTASAAVHEGIWAHSYAVKAGIAMDAALASVLIAMYAACGRLDAARALFDRAPDRSHAVYAAMISAYGSHGRGAEAMAVLGAMPASGIAPDGVCFVSALSACARSGLVGEGLAVFGAMAGHGVEKGQAHYACVVDLLGRAGQLAPAFTLAEAMPVEPGRDVWASLLGACRLHGDVELTKRAAARLFALDTASVGQHAALAQTYEDAGRWDDASRVRRIMQDRRLIKPLGNSIVEALS